LRGKYPKCEAYTNAFWEIIFHKYFSGARYSVHREMPPKGTDLDRIDIVVSAYSKTDDAWVKVIFSEDKRASFATQSSKWKGALGQLTTYAGAYRAMDDSFTTYGMVNIGTYTRFYEMGPGETEWVDFNSSVPYDQTNALEAVNDEALIHALLLDLKRQTRQ
jgi:hypothetical protein